MPFYFTPPNVLKAGPRSKVKVSRTYGRVNALSKTMQRAFAVNLVKGIYRFKSRISPAALFEAWKTKDYAAVHEVIPWDKMPEDIDPAFRTLGNGMSTIANDIVIPSLPAPTRKSLRYDTANPYVTNHLRTRTSELVVNISSTTQATIQEQVRRSFDFALSPRQVANQIKGSIGLYPQLANAVNNLRLKLEKNGVAPGVVDRQTNAYYERLLDYRAMMIARTETRMAANRSQLAVWRSAADQDLIDRGTAKKVWVVDGDPCEVCDPMDGIAVPLDEMWVITLKNGTQMSIDVPTESHPHCLCQMELEFGETEKKIEENTPEDQDKAEEE